MDDKFILMGLNDEKAGYVAEVLKNKTCKKILDFLAETKEASEKDISRILEMPINTVEYNLKKLVKSGLVVKAKNFFWSVKGRKILMYKLARKDIIISPNKKPSLSALKSVLPVLIFAILIINFIALAMLLEKQGIIEPSQAPRKFNSYFEMQNFLRQHVIRERRGGFEIEDVFRFRTTVSQSAEIVGTMASAAPSASVSKAEDYSTTNIQVAGVDEADIVKNDGKYIYIATGNRVVIVDAYPAEDMEILSEIGFDKSVSEIFINKDKLIVFSRDYPVYRACVVGRCVPENSDLISIYDILDRENPELENEIFVDGSYMNSRMIGDYVYIISTKYADVDNPEPPVYITDGVQEEVKANEVYYFDYPDVNYVFTSIMAINIENGDLNSEIYLTGGTSTIYVSQDNIYLTHQKRGETIIHKINVDEEDIEYVGVGEVPGRVLNQFSMDEYGGYFRIATTTGGGNHLYVLDDDLEIVGSIENLAPGESIYSARFMGERAYIVTFKKIDPLFVIDLSEPERPEVLGYLKITGYSDYLHPYDENHLIGIGKETRGGNERFSWYQGVKISLFDVSDVENPIEVDKFEIGDRGTDSAALREHKAVLFDKEKNLLVIPINLAEIDESKYENYEEIPDNAHGEQVWQGAYILNLNLGGISLRGKISHDESYIQRSLYMDDVLYTISQRMVKANDLQTIDEIKSLDLSY